MNITSNKNILTTVPNTPSNIGFTSPNIQGLFVASAYMQTNPYMQNNPYLNNPNVAIVTEDLSRRDLRKLRRSGKQILYKVAPTGQLGVLDNDKDGYVDITNMSRKNANRFRKVYNDENDSYSFMGPSAQKGIPGVPGSAIGGMVPNGVMMSGMNNTPINFLTAGDINTFGNQLEPGWQSDRNRVSLIQKALMDAGYDLRFQGKSGNTISGANAIDSVFGPVTSSTLQRAINYGYAIDPVTNTIKFKSIGNPISYAPVVKPVVTKPTTKVNKNRTKGKGRNNLFTTLDKKAGLGVKGLGIGLALAGGLGAIEESTLQKMYLDALKETYGDTQDSSKNSKSSKRTTYKKVNKHQKGGKLNESTLWMNKHNN